jgi:hypothetical protein
MKMIPSDAKANKMVGERTDGWGTAGGCRRSSCRFLHMRGLWNIRLASFDDRTVTGETFISTSGIMYAADNIAVGALYTMVPFFAD